tara:strand:+ start:44372 stop:44731 length:360 start_codon:yes stop_codon:yes gene_type:complete
MNNYDELQMRIEVMLQNINASLSHCSRALAHLSHIFSQNQGKVDASDQDAVERLQKVIVQRQSTILITEKYFNQDNLLFADLQRIDNYITSAHDDNIPAVVDITQRVLSIYGLNYDDYA